MINVKTQFNARGDGVTDDSIAILSALNSGEDLYFPKGTYIISATLKIEDLKNDLVICGEGIIKRRNGVLFKDFQHMISIKSSKSVNLKISGIGFDGNASGNPLFSGSDPTIFQHSHCLNILPIGFRGFNNIWLENISVKDCTGDGISINGNDDLDSVNTIFATNLEEEKRTRTRSGLTITCGYDSFLVSNCCLEKIEVETNSPNFLCHGNTIISNSIFGQGLDLNYKNNSSQIAPNLLISNSIINGRFNVNGYHLKCDNSTLNLLENNRLTCGNVRCDVEYTNCKIQNLPNFQDQSLITVNNPKTSPRNVRFFGCTFIANPGVKFVFMDNNSVYPERLTTFESCFFMGSCQSVFNFRSGIWRILRNYFVNMLTQNQLVFQYSPNIQGALNYVEIGQNIVPKNVNLYTEPIGNWTILKKIYENEIIS